MIDNNSKSSCSFEHLSPSNGHDNSTSNQTANHAISINSLTSFLNNNNNALSSSSSTLLEVHKGRPVKISVKVVVPVKDHPNFNFIGKLLGPKGNSLKWLQEETQTKMAILGKGSMRDKKKEEDLQNSGDPKYFHLKEDLHVEISAFAPPAEAYSRVGHALHQVQRFLVPDYYDDIRQQQLRELGVLCVNRKPIDSSYRSTESTDNGTDETDEDDDRDHEEERAKIDTNESDDNIAMGISILPNVDNVKGLSENESLLFKSQCVHENYVPNQLSSMGPTTPMTNNQHQNKVSLLYHHSHNSHHYHPPHHNHNHNHNHNHQLQQHQYQPYPSPYPSQHSMNSHLRCPNCCKSSTSTTSPTSSSSSTSSSPLLGTSRTLPKSSSTLKNSTTSTSTLIVAKANCEYEHRSNKSSCSCPHVERKNSDSTWKPQRACKMTRNRYQSSLPCSKRTRDYHHY